MIFPSLLLAAVVLANLVPSLWVLFFIVSILKASAYSLNDPVKELLYQPTSVPIKYKAKAWIDVFGSRLAKAGGSFISHMAHGSVSRLQLVSELPSFAISIILLVLAWQAGTQFQYLVDNNLIVGECTASEENNESGKVNPGAKKQRSDISMLPDRNGLWPGEVGYNGYDPDGLFAGVSFDETSSKNLGSRFGSFVSSKRQLNKNAFKRESEGDTNPRSKMFRNIKIRSSTGALNNTAVSVGASQVENSEDQKTGISESNDNRNRSESADFKLFIQRNFSAGQL